MSAASDASAPVLEVASLQVRPGQTAAFEAAFAQAQRIIASMPGYLGHELQRCMENDHQYVLLVRWRTLEDHTVGFRQSAQYQEWRALLHHFYDPFPTVMHYRSVATLDRRSEVLSRLNALHEAMPITEPVVEAMRRDARY